MNHEVRLTLADGTPLVGWPEVDVTIDMLSPGSPWTLTLHYSDDVSTGLWSLVQRRCLLEESVVLWISSAPAPERISGVSPTSWNKRVSASCSESPRS